MWQRPGPLERLATVINDRIHLYKEVALDLARGCLVRAGEPVHLRPQSYEVLKYLVENKGRLISKDKIIEAVWQGRAVTDGSLGKCIEEVRDALGEDAGQYVRNVRGRGYIFDPDPIGNGKSLSLRSEEINVVSMVIEDEEDDNRAGSQDAKRTDTGLQTDFAHEANANTAALTLLSKVPRYDALALLVLAGLLVTAAGAFTYMKFRSSTRAPAITSIAILPFANVSGDPNLEYLSDGIGEGITNTLSQLPALRVMSRNSVFRYKGREIDALAVGRDLSVQAVLTGRVVQRDDVLSVSVELVDARDNSNIWGEQFNRKLPDLVSLQSEISRDVSRKLQTRLSGADERKLAKNYTANEEAYRLYLQGRYYYLKLTQPEIRKAISFYQQAIDADPTYALAYAGMADAYRTLPIGGWVPSKEAFPQAKAAANRALELDDDLTEAHVVLGWVEFWFDWDWNAAEKELKRAIELSPNNSDAHRAYAQLLSNLARHDEAIAEAKLARELDPLTLITEALEGQFLFYAGHYDEAISRLHTTLQINPDFWVAHNNLGRVYLHQGRFDEAIDELQKAIKLSNGTTEPVTQMGYAFAKSGRRPQALATLTELRSFAQNHYVPAYNFAMIYNGLDEKDQALAYLERSLEEREVQITFIKIDMRWDELRSDPRFQEIMRRVGLAP